MTPHRSMPSACANMSRRKQSNPKAVLKAQEEEYISNSNSNLDDPETMTESSSPVSSSHDETVSSQSPSTCNSPLPPPTLHISRPPSQNDSKSPHPYRSRDCCSEEDDQPDQQYRDTTPQPNELVQVKMEVDEEDEVMPRLRLNVGLASDPALQPDAKDIKALPEVSSNECDPDDESSCASSPFPVVPSRSVLLNELTRSADLAKTPIPPPTDTIPRHIAFVCDPCGIKFSSLSTLEAHQTYYCTHNRKDGEDGVASIAKPGSSTDGVASSSVDNIPGNPGVNSRNSIRPGKQYACSHCSYSADKKVSLNRHMRMHQSSPATSSIASNGEMASAVENVSPGVQMHMVDRYCSDCDIRFSSTKTYRAHKQHYCSGRQREGLPSANTIVTPKSRSQSPQEVNKTPPVAAAPQPYLALPTNPIIIIPYSLIRSASILPGPLTSLTPNISNPDHTCFVLKNGCLHPIAQSLNMPVETVPPPAPVTRPKTPLPPVGHRESPSPSFNASDGSSHRNEQSKPIKRDHFNRPTPSTPLDLSVQRPAGYPRSPRDRSDSISSSFSDEPESERVLLGEGKENVSLDSNASTPENIVCAPSLPGSPGHSPLSSKHNSHSPRGVLITSPNPLQSTLFHQQSMMLRQLLPADLAARLSDPAAIERQNIELALRLSAATSLPESHLTPKSLAPSKPPHVLAQPQIFVKQGRSKCCECNIVFCKYENYIAHKKHYCSARITDDPDTSANKPSPPTSPKAVTSASTASGNGVIAAAPTLAYQQLICAACGIKFTSLDNLNAHQMYYCPKRVEAAVHPAAAPPKDKCTKCKVGHDPNMACAGTASSQYPLNSAVYKCPMCDVVSLNAADSRRHLETHTSIKAFRCTICRYRGNTIRGMRTHIRMHLDKKTDVNEEDYISCILNEGGSEVPPVPTATVTQVLGEGPNQASHTKPNQTSVIANTTAYSVTIKTEPLDSIHKPQSSFTDTPKPALGPVTIPSEPPLKRIKIEVDLTDDSQNATQPQAPAAPPTASNEPKYCNICDIKFTYLNTYLAHKQYYCKEAAAAKSSTGDTGVTPTGGLPASAAVSPQPTVASLQ